MKSTAKQEHNLNVKSNSYIPKMCVDPCPVGSTTVAADLRQELGKAKFVTVTIDASNRKEIKLVPVVVRYFVPDIDVKVKLIEFKSLSGETAEILSYYLVSVLEQNLLGFVPTTATLILEV